MTSSAGINHTQQVATDFFTDRMSGGAAAGDFDGDGFVDLFVTRFDAPDILYRNNGDGTFDNVSTTAGFTQSIATNGAAAGDIDNDGDLDLYVTSFRKDQFYLYVNDGAGVFTEQAVSRNAGVVTDPSVINSRRGNSVSFGDYDRDGYLDIHTTDWGFRNPVDGAIPGSRSAARLLRNVGAANPGHFEDVTAAAGVELQGDNAYIAIGVTLNGVWAFSSRFADIDQDGWDDLLVAGDYHSSRLF